MMEDKTMHTLSLNTKQLISILYEPRKAGKICSILELECGAESLGCVGWSPQQVERIMFAVLRLATERDGGLDTAIKLAKTDWRDLLMSAGFGEDLNAHEKWYKSVTKQ
jgi:hypothetical protein